MTQLVRAPAFQHAGVVKAVSLHPSAVHWLLGHRYAPTCLQIEGRHPGAVNGSLAYISQSVDNDTNNQQLLMTDPIIPNLWQLVLGTVRSTATFNQQAVDNINEIKLGTSDKGQLCSYLLFVHAMITPHMLLNYYCCIERILSVTIVIGLHHWLMGYTSHGQSAAFVPQWPSGQYFVAFWRPSVLKILPSWFTISSSIAKKLIVRIFQIP